MMKTKTSCYCEVTPKGKIALGCTLFLLACTSEVGGGVGGEQAAGDTAGSASANGSGSSPTPDGTGGAANVAASSGTSGTVTGGTVSGGGTSATQEPPAFEPAPAMLRRLTRAQFQNSLRDLMGVEVDGSELDADSFNGDFATIGASTVVTSELGVERYHSVIEAAVDEVFSDPARQADFIGCSPSAADDSCVRNFIDAMGRRAWRRPLDSSEIERLVGVAKTAAAELGSPAEGVHWATVALFTSPNFLYRPELGAPGSNGSYRLTDYEMASRLSFLLWNTGPDEQLLDDAANGVLSTSQGVRSAAERLLGAPGARESVGAFAEEYMRLDRVLTQAKDSSLFPEYGPSLQEAMVREMREVWQLVAFDEDASVLDLFSTTKVVANSDLAQLYGLDASDLDSDTFRELSLPADGPRIGILSKAGFLSQFANQKEGSPTLRGRFIREALTCVEVPPPPPNATLVLPESTPDTPMTKRQRLEMHRSSPTCAGCHGLMDPMGLPLESFDAIGRFRTTDNGLPIDPSGEFDGTPVADARELGLIMSQSDTVANCIVRKYYSYAVGHEERDVDASVIQNLTQSFEAAGYRLRSLMLDIVTSDAFASVLPQP